MEIDTPAMVNLLVNRLVLLIQPIISSYPQGVMQLHRISDNTMQILMNVLKTAMSVLRHVLIHLEATPAPVAWAIAWQVIDMDVMVNTSNPTSHLKR